MYLPFGRVHEGKSQSSAPIVRAPFVKPQLHGFNLGILLARSMRLTGNVATSNLHASLRASQVRVQAHHLIGEAG